MTRLTSAQRRALDGEADEVVSPRDLAIPPDTPMIDSCYDPGLCDYVETAAVCYRPNQKPGVNLSGWRCMLTKGHRGTDHVLGYPPGFDVPGPTYGEGPRAPVVV